MNDIDFVIPWVDASDKRWQDDLFKYAPEKKDNFNSERYRDWSILKFWFRGVEKFSPWVRKIHFVTYGHLPNWLNVAHPQLHIVRHEDYIPEQYLPVFSSHPIEIFFNKIKGLADNFVYFNDDMFIINSMSEDDFFRSGLPCDVAAFNALTPGDITHILLNDVDIINKHFFKKNILKSYLRKWVNLHNPDKVLRNFALLPWPAITGFYEHHLPQPYLKKTLDDVWQLEKNVLQSTASSKFRNNNDVNMYLFRYWQLCSGNFTSVKFRTRGKYFSIDNSGIDGIVKHIVLQKTKMITLNDSEDVNFELAREQLINAFEKILPHKSKFEL